MRRVKRTIRSWDSAILPPKRTGPVYWIWIGAAIALYLQGTLDGLDGFLFEYDPTWWEIAWYFVCLAAFPLGED